MNALLGALLSDTDIELVAVTLPELGDETLAGAAGRLFEAWDVGGRARGGRGLLLVVTVAEELVRLEVGYELEAVVTDAFVSYVERRQMAQYFAAGEIGPGFEATVELIARRAFEAILGRAFDPGLEGSGEIGGFRTGGAGAQAPVPRNVEGPSAAPAPVDVHDRYSAQPTPELAWECFLELNRRRIKDAELGIYDAAASRVMGGVVSDAGQDHIDRLYAEAVATVRVRGDLAAIVFLDDPEHLLAPWFYRRGKEGWQLNGSMYPNIIGYNHLNQWRFKSREHAYTFAFEDFRLDRNGFAFPTSR